MGEISEYPDGIYSAELKKSAFGQETSRYMQINKTVVYAADATPFYEETALQAALCRVDQNRREKIKALADNKGKALSLAAGLLLRRAGRENGLSEKDTLLAYEESGRPFLKHRPETHISLSHSGSLVACALSPSSVGVDIQIMIQVKEGIARRFFTIREAEALDRCAPDTARRLFFRYWTAKEGYAKMTGKGLAVGLNTFYADLDRQEIQDAKSGAALARLKEYDLQKFGIQQEYCLTVVSAQRREDIKDMIWIHSSNL